LIPRDYKALSSLVDNDLIGRSAFLVPPSGKLITRFLLPKHWTSRLGTLFTLSLDWHYDGYRIHFAAGHPKEIPKEVDSEHPRADHPSSPATIKAALTKDSIGIAIAVTTVMASKTASA
jgi:hypothetical protein